MSASNICKRVHTEGKKTKGRLCSYQFIASQFPLLPCFVILELDPINTSPLPDGTMCQ